MTGPVVSPGGWRVPPGRKPGWDWTPPGGATVRPDRMRRTVRLLYPTPFLDRYAYQRIWWRGGWDVDPPPDLEPAEAALLVRSRPDRRNGSRSTSPGGSPAPCRSSSDSSIRRHATCSAIRQAGDRGAGPCAGCPLPLFGCRGRRSRRWSPRTRRPCGRPSAVTVRRLRHARGNWCVPAPPWHGSRTPSLRGRIVDFPRPTLSTSAIAVRGGW